MKMTKAVGVVCMMIGAAAMLCVAAEPAKQSDPKRESKAKQVASAWFESLMRGDTAVTTALSDVPFAMDRKQTVESISELEKMLDEVVAKKGSATSSQPPLRSARTKRRSRTMPFLPTTSSSTS